MLSLRTLSVAAFSLTVGFSASADSRSEVMRSRYMKYNFCMQSALGQLWWKKSGVEMGMNSWGVSEPTAQSIVAAPIRIQSQDLSCRKENEVQDRPRPRVPWPEKKNSD